MSWPKCLQQLPCTIALLKQSRRLCRIWWKSVIVLQFISPDCLVTFHETRNGQSQLLTPLWWRSLSCTILSIDLQSGSMDWFLNDRDLCHKGVKGQMMQKTRTISGHNKSPNTLFIFRNRSLLFCQRICVLPKSKLFWLFSEKQPRWIVSIKLPVHNKINIAFF